jgi:hypothetical protein
MKRAFAVTLDVPELVQTGSEEMIVCRHIWGR